MLEALRCPAPHDPSPLIAAVTSRAGDDVQVATLGCPRCAAEYVVHDGWARLGSLEAPGPGARPDDDALMRAGALLGLIGGGGSIALAPTWAEYAHPLVALTDVAAVVVGPPSGFATGGGVSAVAGVRALPFAPGTFRGVALDAWVADDPAAMATWVLACAPRGRVVAAAELPVPAGVKELARDARHWVGERESVVASAPIALARARPEPS
jgi:hypothetical protein